MALVLHKATITNGTTSKIIFFMAPKDAYTGLSDETGITEAAETDDDEVPSRVPDILANGALIRVAISYTVGAKRKTGKLLVAKDKLATALGALDGQSYKGGTIKSARVPRKLSFY
jgi:hypothetical protein